MSYPQPVNLLQKSEPQDYYTQAQQAAACGDWQAAARLYAQAADQRAAELALIHSVQAGLSTRLEMQAIYNLVGDMLRDTFNAQVVMISQYDPATQKIFHHYAIERGQHLNIPGWHAIDSSRGEIVRTGRPFIINLAEIVRVLEAGLMHIIPGTELPRTWLGVPMLVGDQVRGIVSLQNLDVENAFSASDIALLNTLTNSMSQSLENARLFSETQSLLERLEDEMEMARQTQQSILPDRLPAHPGYDFAGLMIPAKAVGGDFYDFIPLHDGGLCIVIGDVSDKGLPAALFMALTFSLLRAETGHGRAPAQILRNVNRYLLNMNTSGMFVTLLYCVLDCKTGLLQYLRAGHQPPVVLSPAGEVLGMSYEEGQPLGLFRDVRIDQQQIIIPEGGLALLFSDGLNEAVDKQGREFGLERIRAELLAQRGAGARALCEHLWQAVQAHSQDLPHQDDFTAVVIKREAPGTL